MLLTTLESADVKYKYSQHNTAKLRRDKLEYCSLLLQIYAVRKRLVAYTNLIYNSSVNCFCFCGNWKESFLFANIYQTEMDCKGHNHSYNIDKIRKAHEEQNNKKNENVVKCSDNVDAGRGCVNHNKLNESKTLSELSKGHKVMMSVLSARLLRLTAAQTLWHKDMNSFIEYILRVEDNAVVVDILPILTKRVRNEGTELSTLSMGACLDLLPVLADLLESKYEDYIVTSINMIREVMKRWWKELQMMGKKEKREFEIDHRCSRYCKNSWHCYESEVIKCGDQDP
ncbi:uncharacterized protein LOC114522348 isoform X2 [Dendronephthya gigantea]|uniref:uncharacterized protein LOC114522348 isoform X2 n=1 Tax=Dendronephthya gigantea TaxID=151771 RepID=UPI00106D47D6|nr:uncharacterized protein LOC114522348 isoform X2 [Dendronephthya gigantea]